MTLSFSVFGEMSIPSQVELSDVYMGERAPFTVIISNQGKILIKISKIKPSCSCVLLDSFVETITPQGNIKVTGYVDTSNRLGPIKKSLRIYQRGKIFPTIVTLKLNTIVFPAQHIDIKDQDMFMGTCAVCHVDQGVGKFGKALYLSDCAICHGISLEHTDLDLTLFPNMDLISFSNNLDRSIASHGRGFSKVLTQEQLASLLNYLGRKTIPENTSPFSGQQIYLKQCSDCHGQRRGGPIGPPLSKDVLSQFSSQKTRSILSRNVPNLKPNHQNILSITDLQLLIDFLHPSSAKNKR